MASAGRDAADPDGLVDQAAAPDARADTFRDLPTASLPDGVPAPWPLVVGRAELAGNGETSCSHQKGGGSSGDTWCAFKRPGAGAAVAELWVVNVTRSLPGAGPACDGSSADCLRLTERLWTAEPILGPRPWDAHRFDGDTLIFHADALSDSESPYTGAIYAWRPGWQGPRRLASRAYACYGHLRLPLALCIDNIAYDGAAPLEYDLRVGSLNGIDPGPLPLVERVRYSRAERQHGTRVGLTSDGQYLVYTTAASADAPTPGLRVARLGTAGTAPAEILPDVMSWELSGDGSTIFYLSGFADGLGTLAAADFPSGGNPRRSAIRTGRFLVLIGPEGQDRGVGFFRERGGRFLSEFRIIPDGNLLAESVLVFRYPNPLEDFHLSPDGRYVGYAKADDSGFNGYLVRTDGTEECMLNSERDRPAFEPFFLPDSSRVFWYEDSPEGEGFQDGWFGDPAGCRDRRLFAERLAFHMPVGRNGIVFGDGLDLQSRSFTLKYAALDETGGWPAGGAVRVKDRVVWPVALLRSPPGQLVFQVVAEAESASGIFTFGALPSVGHAAGAGR